MKKFVYKFFLKIFSLAGLHGDIGVELVHVFSRFRGILAVVFILTLIIPSMELGFVGALYVLLSSEKQATVLSIISSYGLCDLYPSICNPALTVYFISVFAGILVVLFIAARFAHSYCLAKLNYETYIMYASRLLSDCINMPPMRILSLDRSKMVNSVVLEVAMFGSVVTAILSLVTAAGTAVLFFASAAAMSATLLIISFSVGASLFLLNRYGYKKARKIGGRRVAALNRMLARTYDILEAFRAIKIEGAEERILRAAGLGIRSEQRWRFDVKWNMLSVGNLSQGFTYVVLFAIIFVAVVIIRLDVAMMLTFMVLMARLQKVFLTGQTHWMKIKQNTASLEMVSDVLALCRNEQRGKYMPPSGDRAPLQVRFDKVGFKYPDGEWVHKSLSFVLEAGDRVLIQGKSGQGKSTLLYLLLGLLEPTSGTIYYNDRPFDRDAFEQMRGRTAYAAPDLHLFRDSIRANLELAGEFNDAQLQEAILKARLEEVVSNIDGGLDGFIGENGSQLSLGERQRVFLARIFLKRPELLVLDEATSNLDIGLENDILADLLQGLEPEAILVFVAHKRPQQVAFNRLFSLNHGKLQELQAANAVPMTHAIIDS